MLGAILGDMIGAPYEFDRGRKTKDFPLFIDESQFTDDSVMTIAVAEALLATMGKSDDDIKAALVDSLQKWGKKYPNAGYGCMFSQWLNTKNPKPYGSFGNGSAMRVSAVGWLYDDIETTRHIAKLTAEVTHNHPEGIKGAEAITAFLEGQDFEDVIRTAVSLGGDCDTLTCISGSIAEAFYGIPEELTDEGLHRISSDLRAVINEFYMHISRK